MGLSGNVLPIHPLPKPGEIFSSWYCRIAHGNRIKLHTLEVKLWDRTKQIWTRDIDRSIDDETLRTVADACGTEFGVAQSTCLRSYEGNLFRSLNANGHSNWISPSGIYHRKRKLRGMQFCPLCLGTDEIPYFRKSWRLSLVTFCELHDVMLHDCCPRCKSPIEFYRQELGKRWYWDLSSSNICATCGFDLTRAAGYRVPAFEIHTLIALKTQLFFLNEGWTTAGDQTHSYSHLYFDTLRNLIQKLHSNMTTGRLLKYVLEKFSLNIAMPIDKKIQFEFLNVTDRHCLLQIATWLLLDWPNRFLEIGKELGIRYSELMRDFEDGPFWFNEGAKSLEINPIGPSVGERAAMRGLLVAAAGDEIRLDWLKRHVRSRIANHAVRELWVDDSCNMPSTLGSAPTASRILVTAWRSKKVGGVYGLRIFGIKKNERSQYFPTTWTQVEIEIDGAFHVFPLRKTSWGKCPEFRGAVFKDWLERWSTPDWPELHPPQFELRVLGEGRFRLVG